VADDSDAELLERFVTSQDEAAFAALMSRHGPMVFGICRRLLRHTQDAEDAFQATFLILVRKAASIGKRELLGNWLYGVALRVTARARDMAAKRRTREATDMERIAEATREPSETTDVSAAITEEVQRLPAKYRIPVVLCYLEGRSNEDAAGEMRCPVGTVKTRLSRAREMLRKRLTHRGLALSTAAFSTALPVEALATPLPPALFDSALKAALDFAAGDAAALGLVSAQATALTKGVLHTMFVSKMKILAVWVLALGVILGGASAFTTHLIATAPLAEKTDKENIQGTWKVVSLESEGDTTPKAGLPPIGMMLVFKADKIVPTDGKIEKGRQHTYRLLDTKKTPKVIELTPLDEPAKGKPQKAIYELKGDRLKLCVQNGDGKPPTEFATKRGDGLLLLIFERAKK
jgi:RNA polymerase sigma factor (sigma-70 family)